jgi:hypothetical protein
MLDDSLQPERGQGEEPDAHDGPEGLADLLGAKRLGREQQQQDRDGAVKDVGLEGWRHHVQPLERGQHRDRRRHCAVAIDQRRAEQPDRHDHRALLLLDADQRHHSQDAALSRIVEAHGHHDVFDRGDDHQRPEHQAKRTENDGRIGLTTGEIENRLEGVERTCADIAEHDAQRRQPDPERPDLGMAMDGARIVPVGRFSANVQSLDCTHMYSSKLGCDNDSERGLSFCLGKGSERDAASDYKTLCY